MTYKRDANDIRESPALEVLRGLYEKGAVVRYVDPYVPSVELNGEVQRSTNFTSDFLRSMDCVVVLTDHSAFNYEMIVAHSPLIVDTRNVLRAFSSPNIISL